MNTIADAVASDFAFFLPTSSTYNLSRSIMMTWLNLLPLLFFSSAVKAQHRNGTQNDDYGVYTNLDPTLAVVIVALICALFFLSVFTIFIRHFSEPAVSANLTTVAAARRQIGLDPAVIEKFPVFFYSDVKDVKIGRDTLECAICLNEFEDHETLRLLPICNHVFHPECIDEWLASRVTCPVCRAVLAVESGETPKDPPPAVNRGDFQADPGESRNEVAITVNYDDDDDQNRGCRLPRLSSSGRFLRSHSTGHSLGQGGEKTERYTLRLPEEARTQIMANAKLKRAFSVNVVSTKEWSVRKGYRIGGEGSRQLGWSMRINPVFVSKGSGFRFGFS